MLADGRRFEPILNASSIALIGASSDPRKLAALPLHFLQKHGFAGKLYPVNPSRETIRDLRCFPSVKEIGQPVDLALVMTAASRVADTIEEAALAGVKNFIVYASGFGELGTDGKHEQDRIGTLVKQHSLSLQGPNCVGVINANRNLCATISSVAQANRLHTGTLAFAGQSGALAAYWLDGILRADLGFSKWISTGNEVDLTLADAIAYLVDDEHTKVIGVYIEGVRDADALRSALEAAHAADKPVLALKAGQSQAGAIAAVSHTGALTGDDAIWNSLFAKLGVRRVRSLSEMIDASKLLLWQAGRRSTSPAIISVSGGAAALVSDAAVASGMAVEDFSPEIKERLAAALPDYAQPQNPLDITGTVAADQSLLSSAVDILVREEGHDCIIVFVGLLDHAADALVAALSRINDDGRKMVAVVWMGASQDTVRKLEAAEIPVFGDIPECLSAVALASGASKRRSSGIALRERVARRSARAGETRSEIGSQEFIAKAFDRPWQRLVRNPEDLQKAEFPFPVVAKLQSPAMPHKSEHRGVALGIRDNVQLRQAVQAMTDIAAKLEIPLEGVLVQAAVGVDFELIVSIREDGVFGPILTVGRGGTNVEVDLDIISLLLPASVREIETALLGLRCARIFCGLRGKQTVGVHDLARRIAVLCEAYHEQRDLIEIEVNPLALSGGEVIALDALAVVAKGDIA